MSPEIALPLQQCSLQLSGVVVVKGQLHHCPIHPDRLGPPTAASVHSQQHMGGMWPSRAHVHRLDKGIIQNGGVVLFTLSTLVDLQTGADATTIPQGQSRVCCMSVRCFALSEPFTLLLNLGQENKGLLNGQHKLHRGEDCLNPGQHHHQEGKEQVRSGKLIHLPGQEHHLLGFLHHHQREDQDLAGQCILQQRLHHHLLPQSPLSQTQDTLDQTGTCRGLWEMAQNGRRRKHGDYMDTGHQIQIPLWGHWIMSDLKDLSKKKGQWHLKSCCELIHEGIKF